MLLEVLVSQFIQQTYKKHNDIHELYFLFITLMCKYNVYTIAIEVI